MAVTVRCGIFMACRILKRSGLEALPTGDERNWRDMDLDTLARGGGKTKMGGFLAFLVWHDI